MSGTSCALQNSASSAPAASFNASSPAIAMGRSAVARIPDARRRVSSVGKRDRCRRRLSHEAIAFRLQFRHVGRNIDVDRPGLTVSRDSDRPGDRDPDRTRLRPQARLDDRSQHRAVIDDLVGIAPGDRRLDTTGQEDQRHAVLARVGHHIDGIRDPRPEGRDEHGQRTGGVPVALRHEAGRALVTRQNEIDPRRAQPVDQGEDLAAGNAECAGGTCLRQRASDDLTPGHRFRSGRVVHGDAVAVACSAIASNFASSSAEIAASAGPPSPA